MLARKPRKEVNKLPYEPKEWETVPCPMCQSADASLYEKIGDKLQYTYVVCNNCRLVYQSPRPVYNNDFVQAAYGEYYAYDPEYSFDGYEETSDYKAWDDSVREITEFDTVRSAILDVGACMGEFLYPAKKYYRMESNLYFLTLSNPSKFYHKTLKISIFLEFMVI